jgi:hypothetical protein
VAPPRPAGTGSPVLYHSAPCRPVCPGASGASRVRRSPRS